MTEWPFLCVQKTHFLLDEQGEGTKVPYVDSRIVFALVVWSSTVGGGFAWLTRYKNTPGPAAAAPLDWPAATRLSRAPDRATLLMFVHPECPCTRASVAELARLMQQAGSTVDARVLVLKPAPGDEGWDASAVESRAREIPGVKVAFDPEGGEAARFGATTSGQVVLYDAAGRLLFRGGITGARGHEGDNAGRDRVAALLLSGRADVRESRVFGCALFGGKQ